MFWGCGDSLTEMTSGTMWPLLYMSRDYIIVGFCPQIVNSVILGFSKMSKMLQPRLSLILESDSKVKRMRKNRVKLFVAINSKIKMTCLKLIFLNFKRLLSNFFFIATHCEVSVHSCLKYSCYMNFSRCVHCSTPV